jgi:hypothetical protein
MVRSLHFSALALLALAMPTSLPAAPPQPIGPDKNATGTANIILPATINKLYDMDFGFVTVTTAGTAVVDSNTDAVTTTGGVLFAGGSPHAAQFEAVSPSKTVVHIRLPKTAATLTRIGGTETMTVDNWTINGSGTRNVVAHETFAFKVGGTLNVAANQAEGIYEGTFAVTIDYN